MKLSALDTNGHLRNALQWLETLTYGGAKPEWPRWDAAQYAAAREALDGARALMASDLLTLAGDAVQGKRDLRDAAPIVPPGTDAALSLADVANDGRMTQGRLVVPLDSLDTDEGAGVDPGDRQGIYSLKIGGYVGGLMHGADGTLHRCATCLHAGEAMHVEPCSRCVIGSGSGGGHSDKWEPNEEMREAAHPHTMP